MDRVDWLSRGDNRESAGMGHQPQVARGQPAKRGQRPDVVVNER
jgi:hypothetical protein